MSFKNYSNILPILLNSLKRTHHSCNTSVLLEIGKTNSGSINLCNLVDTKFYSTKPRSEFKQIYYGVLTPQIKAVKVFSLSSSIVGIIGQPFLYTEIVSTGNVPVIIASYSVLGFFTFVTPLLLHMITKKYVTHLTYNEETDKYMARVINFFCISREVEFKVEDVVVPEVPGMFTTCQVKGKALMLDPRLFEQPEHYARIMGYDKPLDFKLSETPPEETNINKKNY